MHKRLTASIFSVFCPVLWVALSLSSVSEVRLMVAIRMAKYWYKSTVSKTGMPVYYMHMHVTLFFVVRASILIKCRNIALPDHHGTHKHRHSR